MSRRWQSPTIAILVAVCVSLTAATPVLASAPPKDEPAGEEDPPDAGETTEAETPAEPESDDADHADGEASEDAASGAQAPEPGEPEPEQPTVTQVEEADAPQGGGVAGSVISADDPAAKQAQTDLEGEKLDREAEGVPARMPVLQTAGWWTMFGAVALGTAGGIFSGLAERQEDEAERLALGFDIETGSRFEYGEKADEYEAILDKGNTYQWASRGFLIGAGAVLATSIALFAVQASRSKKEKKKMALRGVSPFGVEVDF
jgi:hypothetical protein